MKEKIEHLVENNWQDTDTLECRFVTSPEAAIKKIYGHNKNTVPKEDVASNHGVKAANTPQIRRFARR